MQLHPDDEDRGRPHTGPLSQLERERAEDAAYYDEPGQPDERRALDAAIDAANRRPS